MIFFVGAGPGDPELITLKGYRLLQEADLVVYAGSLVNPELLDYCKREARVEDSSGMELGAIVDLMVKAHEKGEIVVRLHTGDPSLYGAIGEQMDRLKELDIEFKLVPGVSSFLAAGAALQREFTVPEFTQTVILTRMSGRTPVPETEKMRGLAAHRATMVIFLSVGMIEQVAGELLNEYPADTPAAVLEKVTWPEENIIYGTLEDLPDLVHSAGIKKTALIMVGDFLHKSGCSKLYDKEFEHGYRNAGE